MDIDLDHIRGWIGRSETATAQLDLGLACRFAATFDLPQPQADGDLAPLMIHWALSPAAVATAELDQDGHPKRGGFLPPVPLPRRMWAGGALAFHGALKVGAQVRRLSTITDVSTKSGRSGTLCFVTLTHQIFSDEACVITERQDIVYRGAAEGMAAPRGVPDLADPHLARVVTPEPALLMRYSALTFNAHRIHYDLPYARTVEGYPDLVVHGPLQATLLAQLAATTMGRIPKSFSFRSIAPVYAGGDFTLNAADDAAGLRLWTSQAAGQTAMEARATWEI